MKKGGNNRIILIVIAVFVVVSAIMLWFYFKTFTGNFSTNSDDWGNFGGYLGSITGILAFVGVLISIHISEKRAEEIEEKSTTRFNEENERNIFFQLLDLHSTKMASVEFNKTHGVEAFKEYVNIANKQLNTLLLGQIILEKEKEFDLNELDSIYNEQKELFEVLKFTYGIYFNGELYTMKSGKKIPTRNSIRNLKEYINKGLKTSTPERYKDDSKITACLENYIKQCSYGQLRSYIKIVADFMYKEYGHILGHYFRNMYYVMDTVNNFSDKKNYKELFRAQLSRYELALGVFNAVSSNSKEGMILLLKDFQIFKDVYQYDITVLKVLFQENRNENNQENMIRITNQILDS